VSFSINTNVASLQAQNYLRANSDFQSKTINRVTSGLRIVSSGDDAAGLAIANGFRSDEAVLSQGVRNANDGLSQLQIADGGISNISLLLDRARTLATQSASGTFSGDRSLLNGEFQNVLSEINRQATSIGLNQGGIFAKSLSVFIGGGRGATGAAAISNGSVSIDLSKSTVDAQGLGLKGFTAGYQVAAGAADSGLYDLGASSVSSVSAIIGNTGATSSTFVISGPGFSGGAGAAVTVSVNLSGVNDTASLANAINSGIKAAGTGSAQGLAFDAANITAVIHTGADGHQQLQFTSASTAFQVTAGDTTANGFLGNLGTNVAGSGAALNASATPKAATQATAAFIAGGTEQYSVTYTSLASGGAGVGESQTLTFAANDASGAPQTVSVTLGSATVITDAAAAVAQINTALQASNKPALQSIVATTDPTSGTLYFANASTTAFTVGIGQEATSTTVGTTGAANPNTIQKAAIVGVGGNADVSNQSSAQSAVSALANAVASLGSAQAVVGRGQNQFGYAVNLAQSQLTNLATAESRIRDADLASEAANLTKAQILLQAGVAALAQANSAPQAVLSLLKG
jgi:flagellin